MKFGFVVIFFSVLGLSIAGSSNNRIDKIWEFLVDPEPVQIDLYYESFCPGCRFFVETQLFPTFFKLKDTGIVQFGMYPYGNAKETQNKNGSWSFECQHGEKECTGNIIEACIMSKLGMESDRYIPVISCMEGSDDPVSSARGCVAALSDLDFTTVKKCYTGPEGNALMHSMGVATDKLAPPHNYVPWIVVNGAHNETVENQALTDLTGLVCSNFQGDKPRACDY